MRIALLPLLLTVLLSTLASCASWKTPSVKPAPPRIDCSERTPAEPLPARPALANLPDTEQPDSWWRAYVQRLTGVLGAYERRLLGWGTIEINKRAEVADCLDRERAQGRIR